MTFLHRLRRPRTVGLRDALRSCVFLGVLVTSIAGVVAIVLQAPDPLHAAQGASTLVLLLAALP